MQAATEPRSAAAGCTSCLARCSVVAVLATLRFEPIAQQLGKLASPALLFPPEVLAELRRGDTDHEQVLAPALREFLSHYGAVVGAGRLLLGAPPFERLARLHDELEKLYAPSGPPKSPVYDSHFIQHVLGEIPQGLAGETPYTVLARLSSGDPAREALRALADGLARSHGEVYRVTGASEDEAVVRPLRRGEPFALRLTAPVLREGDLILAHAVPFGGWLYLPDRPYLLQASEDDWLAYFERVAPARAATEAAAKPSGGKAPLTSKQLARRRKQQKEKDLAAAPEQLAIRHLRHGSSDRFWLDFILAAYAGERNGVVRLAGVPDRPDTLPHAGG
jgi:hypothetical protein